ncbi:MAG: transketolase [Candidatus Brocadiae bacterium]|nr:transketolase [Candidatus Brocadiia bacterium]
MLKLARRAAEVRLQIIKAMGQDKFHHFGGSLSVADLLVTLYYRQMRYRAEEPDWPERDRFVLSKGHAVPALYVCLARCGFFPEEELAMLKQLGSNLQGHPDMRKTCGLEANTGSLGMGLSAANGIALAGRSRGLSYRVYALLGDGECQEGQVWEAAMTSAHYRLDNLTVLVDRNELQAMGKTEERMGIEPLAAKWQAFGWESFEIDGHDIGAICRALDEAAAVKGKPSAIVAHTVKGKGVPFMEGQTGFHNAVITAEQFREAEAALAAAIASFGG